MTFSVLNRFPGFLLLLSALFLAACGDEPRHLPDDYASMPYYCDYRITGDDESNEVTVLFQFRAGGPDGPGMLLEEPGSVFFDNYELEPDSSRMFGVYYEQRWLANEFDGLHQIRYISPQGDTLMEKVYFPVFGFAQAFPEKWTVTDTELELTGLEPGDSIHVVLLDTAYFSRGVDRFTRLENNKIKFSAADLERLKKGPVNLEIHRIVERELKQAGEAGGKISLSFVVSRRFILE